MIIVGLGNPGQEYIGTRHNVGFAILDQVLSRLPELSWKKEFGVLWTRIGEHWLIKPQQFMNTSGSTLHEFQQKKGLPAPAGHDLLVIHDDLDFPLGEIREQFDRSAAGHNGIQSIIDSYGQAFARLRVGIGNNRDANVPAEDYVLQKFSAEELSVIVPAIERAAELLLGKIRG